MVFLIIQIKSTNEKTCKSTRYNGETVVCHDTKSRALIADMRLSLFFEFFCRWIVYKPGVIYTDSSLEFTKACEDLSWNHDKSIPQRSETNVIADRADRRKIERTFTDLVSME